MLDAYGVTIFCMDKTKNLRICKIILLMQEDNTNWTSRHKTNMDFSFPIIAFLLHFVILFPIVCPVYSSRTGSRQLVNQSFGSVEEVHKLKKTIRNDLQSINKPAVKTIQVCYNKA